MNEPFDLPWIMAKLRAMLEQYENTPYLGECHALLRLTYRHRDTGSAITLVIGTEPADEDRDDRRLFEE